MKNLLPSVCDPIGRPGSSLDPTAVEIDRVAISSAICSIRAVLIITILLKNA